ncbi:hypothetical protein [Acidithrix sp. C25]|uniref:hypothetical protein n=1 Tax=Acidithrix sp. C25 TaxID=1671482 RepID=UPI00191BC613|nr:hypothetical protein [Acidithrix sp. C25]CAG4929107.1 unnamed protein product [Acidithrix sp. C25]
MERKIGFGRLSRLLLVQIAVVLVTGLVLSVLSVTPASASQVSNTYYVTVYANQAYGINGTFFQTRVSPALPTGVSLTGSASCSTMYDSGETGTTETVPTNGLNTLNVGSYYFVTSSCASEKSYPLALTGTTQLYKLQILGGAYTITPDATKLLAFSSENKTNNTVTLEVALAYFPPSSDSSPLTGQTITFGEQGQLDVNGITTELWSDPPCSQGSTANPSSIQTVGPSSSSSSSSQANLSFATCTLTGQDATNFIKGTGAWTASYAGSTNYKPSFTYGELGGDTSVAQATYAIQQAIQQQKNQVQIVLNTSPPNCHPANQTDTSIITVSIGELSCSQIQILQTVVGVVFGVAAALTFGGGLQLVADIIDLVNFSNASVIDLPTLLNTLAAQQKAQLEAYFSTSI